MTHSTAAEREKFYDDEIAPELKRISDLCRDNGLSFLAVAEWEPGEQGRTTLLLPGCGIGIRITEIAARTNGNIDGLIIALMKYGREHGHNSAALSMLGIKPQS